MKIILIGGKARHGKDTTADYFQELFEKESFTVIRSQISKYLKQYVKDYFSDYEKDEDKPRDLLQKLGTDIIRVKLGKESFFVDRTIEDIEILSNFFDCIIISDIRYPIEFDKIAARFPNDTIKIMLNRINFDGVLNSEQARHLTEIALDDYKDYDYLLVNDTLEKLKEDVEEIFNKEIKNEKND